MNLLFAINQKFIPLLGTCVKSILRSNPDTEFGAYVLHSDLTDDHCSQIRHLSGGRISWHFIRVNPEMFSGFPESKRYPAQIYYRLAAPLLLPKDLDRILYLDVDLVNINPLDELYHMDFGDDWFIACTHTQKFLTEFNKLRLGVRMDKDVAYINTGVLLYNLEPLRQAVRIEDIRDLANEKSRRFILPDQDILTALYGDKVKLADTMRYNLSDRILSFYNASPKNPKLDLDWVRENGVIIHYCGSNKPWNPGYNGCLDVFYRELEAE